MDLRHITAFVAVAEEASFTKAARRLYISQPPLTRRVRQLEIELGVELFVRHHRGIELTNAGRILLEKARAVAQAATSVREAAQALRDQGARTVHVGIAWGLWSVVERIKAHYAKRFPETHIAVSHLCSPHGVDGHGELDVAIVRAPVDHLKYESALLFHEQLVAVLSATHALSAHKKLRLADLASELLLTYEKAVGPGPDDETFGLYTAAGVRPRMIQPSPDPPVALVASRQRFYLGTASPFTQTHRAKGVKVVPIDEPDARMEVRIAWPKRHPSRSVREFLRSARDVFPLKQSERVAASRSSSTYRASREMAQPGTASIEPLVTLQAQLRGGGGMKPSG